MSTPINNRENNQVSTFHAALLASALLIAGLSISADAPKNDKQAAKPGELSPPLLYPRLRDPSRFDPKRERWEDCPGRRTITGYCLPEGSNVYD
jgi:hypothetical protein